MLSNELNRIKDKLRVMTNSDTDDLDKKRSLSKMIMILNFLQIRNDYVNILNRFSALTSEEKINRILRISTSVIELENETIINGIIKDTLNLKFIINYLIELRDELNNKEEEEINYYRNLIMDYINVLNEIILRSN